MRKLKNCKKLNNGGFSLVEVLVTILVLTIISVPLVSNFVSSAKTNLKARRIQAATDVAQNYAEKFYAANLSELLSKYNYVEGRTGDSNQLPTYDFGTYDSSTGEYYLSEKYSNGSEEFDFLVKVNMTATKEYKLPMLHNFYGSSEIVCVNEITKYDKVAKQRLNNSSSIEKSLTFNIETSKDAVSYKYKYTLTITYKNNLDGSTFTPDTMVLGEDSFTDATKDYPTLYIIYNGFQSNLSAKECYDDIKIRYKGETDVPLVNVFFVPQEGIETFTQLYVYNVSYGSENTYNPADSTNRMKYYFYKSSSPENMLVKDENKVYLYNVNVQVIYDGNVIANINRVQEDEDLSTEIETTTP